MWDRYIVYHNNKHFISSSTMQLVIYYYYDHHIVQIVSVRRLTIAFPFFFMLKRYTFNISKINETIRIRRKLYFIYVGKRQNTQLTPS